MIETRPIPNSQQPIHWLQIKPTTLITALTSLGVSVLALMTVGSLGQRLHQLQIETAFVVQPMEPIIATDWGTLHHIYVQEGEIVQVGHPLVRVDRDLAIEDEIARLEGWILAQRRERFRLQEQLLTLERQQQQAHLNLEAATSAIALEQQQIPARSAIAQSQVDAARQEVDALAQQLNVAEAQHDRLKALLDQGAIPQMAFDETVAELAHLQGAWHKAQETLTIAQAVLIGTIRGDFVEQDQLQGQLPTLALQRDMAEKRLKTLTDQRQGLTVLIEDLDQEITTLQTRQDQLLARRDLGSELAKIYAAPVTGVVAKILRSPGNSVSRGATLVVVQHQKDQPQITAYLTHDQAQQLALEQPASIYIPTTGQTYPAHISKIDWTGGRVADALDPLAPTWSIDPLVPPLPVQVHLTIQHNNLDIPNGSPVVATLEKRQSVVQRLQQGFQLSRRY